MDAVHIDPRRVLVVRVGGGRSLRDQLRSLRPFVASVHGVFGYAPASLGEASLARGFRVRARHEGMLKADNEVDAVRMGHEIQRARLNRVAKAFCRPVLTRHLLGSFLGKLWPEA